MPVGDTSIRGFYRTPKTPFASYQKEARENPRSHFRASQYTTRPLLRE